MIIRMLSCLILLSLFLCGQECRSQSVLAVEADSIKRLRAQALEARLKGDGQAALSLYGQAVDLAVRSFGENAPYAAEIYYDMGVTAYSFGKFNPAEDFFRAALQINPNHAPARLKLAELLALRNRHEEALRQSQTVLVKHPGSAEARFLLASSYEGVGNSARAIEEYFNLSTGSRTVAFHAPASPPVKAPPPSPPPAKKAQPAKEKGTPAKAQSSKTGQQKEEKSKKATKPDKAEKKKPAPGKAAPPKPPEAKKTKPQPEPQFTDAGVKADLRSKAELLTKVGKPEPPAKSSSTPDKPAEKPQEKKTPAKPPAEKKPPEAIKPVKKPPAGLVPPPPPSVPVMMPVMIPPPPQAAVKKPPEKPAEKPKPRPVETREVEESGTDDPSFLLDWAGTKSKKKK